MMLNHPIRGPFLSGEQEPIDMPPELEPLDAREVPGISGKPTGFGSDVTVSRLFMASRITLRGIRLFSFSP